MSFFFYILEIKYILMNEIKSLLKGESQINYGVIHGGNKIFIMLPGISLCSILKNINAIEFAYQEILKEYTIYVFDHEMPSQDITFDDIADDIIYALDSLKINKAVIYGVSIGALITLKMSIVRPDLIDKMIIVAGTLKVDEKQLVVLRRWEAMSNEYKIEEMNKDFFTTMFTDDYVNRNLNSLDFFIHNGNKHECDCFSRVIRAMYDFDIVDELRNVNVKAFVIGSDLDPIFGEQASRKIAEVLNADLYIYKNYSHAFYDEAPDFKHRLMQWLEN